MLPDIDSLGDLTGRRRMYAIGVATFTGGSLLCGLATNPLFLSLARAAQGVGGATMFATSLALLANSFHGRERGVAFGIWGATTGVAVADVNGDGLLDIYISKAGPVPPEERANELWINQGPDKSGVPEKVRLTSRSRSNGGGMGVECCCLLHPTAARKMRR